MKKITITEEKIEILLLEDEADDAELIAYECRRSKLDVRLTQVSDKCQYQNRLREGCYDLILADYKVPGIVNLEALQIAKELQPYVPFIYVSGVLGEENAVETLRQGATDYVMKANLQKLPGAILRGLNLAAERNNLRVAEQALRESEAYIRNLLKISPVGVFRGNAKKELTYANDQYCEITGLTPEEASGKGWTNAIHPKDRERVLDNWYAQQGVEEDAKAIFRYKQPKTGEVRWVIGQSISETNEKGEVVGYLGVITDITRVKNAQAELQKKSTRLEQTNHELDSFVYSASHNLRAPLTSLLGLINIIKMDADHSEEVALATKMMERSIHKLDEFIRDIIQYSQNSRLSLSYQPVNLPEIIKRLENEIYVQEMGERPIIEKVIDEKSVLIGDAMRITIILRSLLSNAARYTKPNQVPSIKVKALTTPEYLILVVHDQGTGIEEEHLPNIFKMFYRANESRSGSGLGLYIAKGAVDKMGGTLTVESKYGEYTTVTVTIPNGLNQNSGFVSIQEGIEVNLKQ